MTSNKKTETTILKLLKGFVIGRGEVGYGKPIFEHGADKVDQWSSGWQEYEKGRWMMSVCQ